MTLAALVTWFITVGGGLYLLTIWLIEYDVEFQSAAATRLPVPVISAHALLAISGLAVWGLYLLTDTPRLAWAATFILAAVALLGITMAVRWVGVYRANEAPSAAPVMAPAMATAAAGASGATRTGASIAVPPERHFPLPVVIGHGIFAAVTIVLVLLTALGVGGS
jgi:hypothetical protein